MLANTLHTFLVQISMSSFCMLSLVTWRRLNNKHKRGKWVISHKRQKAQKQMGKHWLLIHSGLKFMREFLQQLHSYSLIFFLSHSNCKDTVKYNEPPPPFYCTWCLSRENIGVLHHSMVLCTRELPGGLLSSTWLAWKSHFYKYLKWTREKFKPYWPGKNFLTWEKLLIYILINLFLTLFY